MAVLAGKLWKLHLIPNKSILSVPRLCWVDVADTWLTVFSSATFSDDDVLYLKRFGLRNVRPANTLLEPALIWQARIIPERN